MAINYGSGEINAENHRFEAHELFALLEQVPDGTVWYVDSDAIEVDGEGEMWIDGSTPAYTEQEVIDQEIDAEIELSRVVRLDQGFFVDESHLNITSKRALNERFMRNPLLWESDETDSFMPVYVWAGNKQEYELALEAIARSYNLVIQGGSILKGESVAAAQNDTPEEPGAETPLE